MKETNQKIQNISPGGETRKKPLILLVIGMILIASSCCCVGGLFLKKDKKAEEQKAEEQNSVTKTTEGFEINYVCGSGASIYDVIENYLSENEQDNEIFNKFRKTDYLYVSSNQQIPVVLASGKSDYYSPFYDNSIPYYYLLPDKTSSDCPFISNLGDKLNPPDEGLILDLSIYSIEKKVQTNIGELITSRR